MMRSLFSGVSGLKVHQTKMDVLGNNISNVNTIGFKGSTVTFSDILYQKSSSASGPNANTGKAGNNAKQIGLGANVAAISTQMSTGGTQRTDNALDVMIEGDPFFVVSNGTQNFFTKAGAFTTDANGTLCTTSGLNVMGWQVDPTNPTKTMADVVSPLRVMAPENLSVPPEATTEIYFHGNLDYKDTQLTGETGKTTTMDFYDALGQKYMVMMSVKRDMDDPLLYNNYRVSVTDILDATGQSIFVSKTVEEDGTITISESAITEFTFGAEGETHSASVDTETGDVLIEMDGIPLSFDPATGKFFQVGEEEGGKSVLFQVMGADEETSPFAVANVDFSRMTMYESSGSSSMAGEKGSYGDGIGAGKTKGSMTGLSLDEAGRIYGAYDNGDTKLLGQIAVATFANPAGLEFVGGNLFQQTLNSGEFNGIGEEVTAGGGKMNTGVVEMSNVDLSTQFTELITTQRGFQANSRVITTSDTFLEELINLKR